MFCSKCGVSNTDEATACTSCGQQLNADVSGTLFSSDLVNEIYSSWIKSIRNYKTFSGRSNRKEFWYFYLIYIVGLLIFTQISPYLGLIFQFGLLCPAFAVGVRRLHDTNRSGWWIFVPVAPIFFVCQQSQLGFNRFDDPPNQVSDISKAKN